MTTIFSLTNRDADYTSDAFDAVSTDSSIEIELTGTFNIDAELQMSIGGNQYDTIPGSQFSAQTAGPIGWNLSVGRPNKIKIVITVNSGTMDTAVGRINNGY